MNVEQIVNCYFDYHMQCPDCDCSSICRSKVIVEVSLDGVFMNIKKLTRKYSTVDAYCIERLIKMNILDSQHNIEAVICDGYYGQEISGWSHPKQGNANREIQECLNLDTDAKKIRYVLLKEYQYIPEHVLNYDTVAIVQHDVNEIRKRNFSGMIKNYDYDHEIYNEQLPIGIVNNQLNLIDGFHRVANCEAKTAKFIELSL